MLRRVLVSLPTCLRWQLASNFELDYICENSSMQRSMKMLCSGNYMTAKKYIEIAYHDTLLYISPHPNNMLLFLFAKSTYNIRF